MKQMKTVTEKKRTSPYQEFKMNRDIKMREMKEIEEFMIKLTNIRSN